jgi:urea transporter/murein DD-endopeptidase MepM/ murein hydrolase activator NlpD
LISLRYYGKLIWEGILHSYAQVFFSNHLGFAFVLLLVSFFDLGGGLGSIAAVLFCQFLAIVLKYNHEAIRDGSLTYNALMVGTAIGFSFEWNLSILVLILVASTLTFFITVWYSVSLGAKRLPFLSIPFLLGIWVVLAGAPNFSLIKLSPKSALSLFNFAPELFITTTNFISNLHIGNYLHLLFRSTGAIFFQYNDLAGIIILLGILWQSRISFLLAIYSFSIGYLFYSGLEGNFSQLIYSYIGFNFILTGIALGGFFVVPSWRSFLLVGLVIPLNALLISGLHPLFQLIGLPMFSLPFNLVVILSLMMIWYRYYAGGIIPVVFQEYSPEKHVYKNRRNIYRYGKQTGVYLSLPVMGEWHISQAYNGKHTHKGIFACAYDFDLVDEKGKTFQNDGTKLEDFYCYNLPVIAPGAGYVTDIREGIEDNQVSEVNLEQNWGNSIVIKHLDGLFSQISHLKPGSVDVKLGDFVYKGQLIGRCGSSGRSPEPHLHFQVQTAPYVGAPTIAYPFSYYIKKQNNKDIFHSFEYPKEGETIKNVRSTNLLVEAFNFIPGKKIRVELSTKNDKNSELWTIHTNSANQTYIHSDKGLAVAYFINDGSCFYFTEYYGEKSSLLYCFYEAAYKVSLGYYEDLALTDELLPQGKLPFVISVLQDFAAPFIQFTHVKYVVVFNGCDDPSEPKKISIKSRISLETFGKQFQDNFHEIQVQEGKITQLVFNAGGPKEKLIRFYEG